MLKKNLLLAITVSLITACKKDPVNPSTGGSGSLNGNDINYGTGSGPAAARATLNGSNITFTQFAAQVNSTDMIISISDGIQLIEIAIYDTKPGVYPVGNNASNSCVYVYQSTPYYTGYSGAESEIKLTEVDLVKKEITGTFSFTSCDSPNGNCRQILNGVLNNIPIN